MSKENVEKFFDEASKNEELQKKINEIFEKSATEAIKAQAEALTKLANESGFDCTEEELAELAGSTDEKISLDKLDSVAGGFVHPATKRLIESKKKFI